MSHSLNLEQVSSNINRIKQHITTACEESNRPNDEVTLMAVTKGQTADTIKWVLQAGVHVIGESYVDEALEKIHQLEGERIEWHFIGPIQSNKTKPIAAHFNWVHGLCRQKIAHRLNEQRPQELGPLNVCIEVNIDQDPNKQGISVDECSAFAKYVDSLPNLTLRGLMTMPSKESSEQHRHRPFRELKKAMESLKNQGFDLDTLSMGMSEDYMDAIAEGATIIRVGTALFT